MASVADPLFDVPGADAALPEGVIVTTIGEAADEHGELLRRYLGSLIRPDDDVFVALNDAGFRAGAFVYVPRGVVLESPVSLRTVQARTGTLLNQRSLVVLEEGAQAEVWEQFLSADDELDGVFNVVTELIVGTPLGCDMSAARRCRSAAGSSAPSAPRWDATPHWTGSRSGSDRRAATCGWRRGSKGHGAEARVTGAYATHGRQHIDFDTTQEHAARTRRPTSRSAAC